MAAADADLVEIPARHGIGEERLRLVVRRRRPRVFGEEERAQQRIVRGQGLGKGGARRRRPLQAAGKKAENRIEELRVAARVLERISGIFCEQQQET